MIHDSFAYIVSKTNTLRRWVVNYTERTGIRINLFFNVATQSDSRTNLEIARLSSKIAVSTQRDSSSMITCASLYVYWSSLYSNTSIFRMAAVTMLFLPGTFVSYSSTQRLTMTVVNQSSLVDNGGSSPQSPSHSPFSSLPSGLHGSDIATG